MKNLLFNIKLAFLVITKRRTMERWLGIMNARHQRIQRENAEKLAALWAMQEHFHQQQKQIDARMSANDNSTVTVTNHAIERAKERLGWNRKSLVRMAEKAMAEGITHAETVGSLNRYISKLWLGYRTANNIRIYGENVFLFSGRVLITVYRLPREMCPRANRAQEGR